jgi:A/G-specific adenine glycosylase
MQQNNFTLSILTWYNKQKRILPFRDIDDPYKIWLSEVMLQQTQIETVIPYFQKWISKYPTILSVATADQECLLKLWEGLGYYSRCRNFHKATKIVVAKHGGVIPDKWLEFRALPGVGDYTAAAVLSIAYSQPYIAIDGNVKRVMARILGLKNLSNRNMTRIKNYLTKNIFTDNPGDFNQSMMELGARICSPRNPNCGKCPLSFNCKAFSMGEPESYPLSVRKKKPHHYEIVVGIVWRGDEFYIQKRGEHGMLAGLWEFPGGKVEKDESLEDALYREIQEECGSMPKILKKIGTIKHAYTHFTITFHGYHCEENGTLIRCQKNSKWIKPNQIDEFPFPKANHKLFSILEKQGWDV